MKFKVSKKDFAELAYSIMSQGKLRFKDADDYKIKTVIVSGSKKTNKLNIKGCSYGILYARGNISVEILEEGENMPIDDFPTIMRRIEHLKGKYIDIEISNNAFKATDGSMSFSEGLGSVNPNVFKDAIEWSNTSISNNETVDNETVKFMHPDAGEFDYTKWFVIENGEYLGEDIKITDVELKICEFTITPVSDKMITYYAKVPNYNKDHGHNIPAKVFDKQSFTLDIMYPVFRQLKGKSIFYYHVLTDGSTNIWVTNENVEWMTVYRPKPIMPTISPMDDEISNEIQQSP